MNFIGVVTNVNAGIWVNITALKAEYGPLSFLGQSADYSRGDRVLVSKVGPDEYIVLGVIGP